MESYKVSKHRGELVLSRHKKVFAYLIPAEIRNVDNLAAVAEFQRPLAGFGELYNAAEATLEMLKRVQLEEDGPGVAP